MSINLFTSYYIDKDEKRNSELLFCLDKNLNQNFKHVFVLYETNEERQLLEDRYSDHPKLIPIRSTKRPSFNQFFKIMDTWGHDDEINVLANTDIFFMDLGAIIEFYANNDSRICLALSRWDYYYDHQALHFCRADSQDVWVFKGKPNFEMKDLDFNMGVAGCDNRLAHELEQGGFTVLNPSKTIKTYHYHNSGVRNYIVNGEVTDRVPPPYKLVEPY